MPPGSVGMNILAAPSADLSTVLNNLDPATTPLFRAEMVPMLWQTALTHGIDPVGMIAQSAHETGWGSYPGNVKAWFYNPAGIKVRYPDNVRAVLAADRGVPVDQVSSDHPLVHAIFPNWKVGITAHAQHLWAYCGRQVPLGMFVVDPRYVWVAGTPNATAVTWGDLGGRWAPSRDYGTRVETLIHRLRGG